MCNVHYNKDHHQLPSDCNSLVEQTCLACCQNVKTTKLQPCIQHTLCGLNIGMLTNSAISCCFFSEYCTERTKLIDNYDLYHTSKHFSEVSSYICMNCKEPYLELAKVKRSYEEKQEKVNKLMGKNDKHVDTEQANTKTNSMTYDKCLDQVSHQQIYGISILLNYIHFCSFLKNVKIIVNNICS